MAYLEKRVSSKGVTSWRVQIRRRGVVETRTFRTKARAREWALEVELGITDGRPRGKHTLVDAMRRYAEEASPAKRGGRWEAIRLSALESSVPKVALALLDSEALGRWRNARLEQVGPATVRREMNLLQAVLETARVEWKWVKVNPFRDVKKPQEPPARRRGVTDTELAALREKATGAGYSEVLAGFELGIESGMRAGEMWALEPEQIDLKAGVAHLEQTKNGDQRDVALSPRAIQIIEGLLADGRPALFTITNAVRDALFRKLRNAAGIPDLHFHDSRSEAVSRLSKRLPIMELADQIGHRDISSLLIYYKPSVADRAMRLRDGPGTRPQPLKRPTAGGRRRP